jgi:hypothetical protein
MQGIRSWTIEDTMRQEEGYSVASFHLDHARYVCPDRREVEVNIRGVNQDRTEAILLITARRSDFPQLEKDGLAIFYARRSSEKERTPGTWYWTEAQIQDDLNDPENEETEEIRPRSDRKNEIIVQGYELGQTKAQIQARLRAGGFNDEWNESYENGRRIVRFQVEEEYSFDLKPFFDESLPQKRTTGLLHAKTPKKKREKKKKHR